MSDKIIGLRKEWETLRNIAAAACRLREAHERVLSNGASDEILEAVREEARALRSLDDALRALGQQTGMADR